MSTDTLPATDGGRWLLDHQGLINIGKIDGGMRGDEIDLRAAILTIERDAWHQGWEAALAASVSPSPEARPVPLDVMTQAWHRAFHADSGIECSTDGEMAARLLAALTPEARPFATGCGSCGTPGFFAGDNRHPCIPPEARPVPAGDERERLVAVIGPVIGDHIGGDYPEVPMHVLYRFQSALVDAILAAGVALAPSPDALRAVMDLIDTHDRFAAYGTCLPLGGAIRAALAPEDKR